MATFRDTIQQEARTGIRDYFERNTGFIGQAMRSTREKKEEQQRVEKQLESISSATLQVKSSKLALMSMETSFIQISKNMQLIAQAMNAEVTLQKETDKNLAKLEEIAERRRNVLKDAQKKYQQDLNKLNKKIVGDLKQQQKDSSLLDKLGSLLDDFVRGGKGGKGGRGGKGGGGRTPPGRTQPSREPPRRLPGAGQAPGQQGRVPSGGGGGIPSTGGGGAGGGGGGGRLPGSIPTGGGGGIPSTGGGGSIPSTGGGGIPSTSGGGGGGIPAGVPSGGRRNPPTTTQRQAPDRQPPRRLQRAPSGPSAPGSAYRQRVAQASQQAAVRAQQVAQQAAQRAAVAQQVANQAARQAAIRGGAQVAGRVLSTAAAPVALAAGAYQAAQVARETQLGERLAQGQGGRAQTAFRQMNAQYGADISPESAKAILDQPDSPGKRRDIQAFGGLERLQKLAAQAKTVVTPSRQQIYGQAPGRQQGVQRPAAAPAQRPSWNAREQVFTGPMAAQQRPSSYAQEHVFTGPMAASARPAAPAAAAPARPAPAQAAPQFSMSQPDSRGLVTLMTKKKKAYQVHAKYAKQFQGFVNDVEATGYDIKVIGGQRPGERKYHHWYGGAIDINPAANPMIVKRGNKYFDLLTNKPADHLRNSKYPFGYGADDFTFNPRALAAKWGLGWGGDWTSSSDTMHFSVGHNEGGNPNWPGARPSSSAEAKKLGLEGAPTEATAAVAATAPPPAPPSNVVMSGSGVPITTGSGGFVTSGAPPTATAKPSAAAAPGSTAGGVNIQGSGQFRERALAMARAMEKFGITNPFAKAVLISAAAKESGLNPLVTELGANAWIGTINSKGLPYFFLHFPQLGPGGVKAIARGKGATGFSKEEIIKELSGGDQNFFELVYGGYELLQAAQNIQDKSVAEQLRRFGRMNPEKGDGWRYRGKGYIGITGRTNYRSVGSEIGQDLEGNPDKIVSDAETAGAAALAYMWKNSIPGGRGTRDQFVQRMNALKRGDVDSELRDVLLTIAGRGKDTTNFLVQGSNLRHQYQKAGSFIGQAGGIVGANLNDFSIQAATMKQVKDESGKTIRVAINNTGGPGPGTQVAQRQPVPMVGAS